MPLGLVSKAQLREIQWGTQHQWDVFFTDLKTPDLLGPFTTWFPATEVEENVYILLDEDQPGIWTNYKFPTTTSSFNVQITFHDDYRATLVNWLTDWVNNQILGQTVNGGKCVNVLDEIVKQLTIVKYTPTREVLRRASYYVYPMGGMYMKGTSDVSLIQEQVDFYVAGTISIERFDV